MSKKTNIFVLSFFLVASFLLISATTQAQQEITTEWTESNCCEPRESCNIWLEGVKGGICCEKLPGDEQNALLDPCCDPKFAEENSSCYVPYEPIEMPTANGDDDDSFAGCDDSTCENTVCQIEPSCCMSAIPHNGDDDDDDDSLEIKPLFPGGWNEQCASLANNFCSVCEGGTPLVEIEKDSDGDPFQLYSIVDLRDRESFVQVTNLSSSPVTIHVQVFDVSNLCNENNFFDVYTGNDTHVYNLRDITTNDGNPAGFVLPENAYGIAVVTVVTGVGGQTLENSVLVGNFRIVDDAGYEYRTNSLGIRSLESNNVFQNSYFNYNQKGDVTLSDIIGLPVTQEPETGEVSVTPAQTFAGFDIDIYDLDENVFSCKDITFACAPATFEYGINDAIPNSRGGDVLCDSNVVPEGIVLLSPEESDFDNFVGYVGLNNGNGRGSMDSFWFDNFFISANQIIGPLPIGP